jgi:hypothetical protein
MRIKTTTHRDAQQKPCQFYWHGFLHITIVKAKKGVALTSIQELICLEIKSKDRGNGE